MKISQDTMELLENGCRVQGNLLFITRQLDRAAYQNLNKVLEAAGGKWNRKAKAHVFEQDIDGVIENIIMTGEITTHQDIDFFPTPADVADEMITLAGVQASDDVLEPSAGDGAIAVRIQLREAKVIAVEKDVKLYNKLCKRLDAGDIPYGSVCGDFLEMAPGVSPVDKVIMNPPFSKQADIKHVMHAFKFLKPGGRLVAVMSNGVTFRQNALTLEFRQLVRDCGGQIIPQPAGSFKSSGTMVNTVLVVLNK